MDKNFVMKELWPVGSRVKLRPGTDRWMMGDRLATSNASTARFTSWSGSIAQARLSLSTLIASS